MCEHGTFYSIFGQGGGQRLSQELGVPLIGSIPIDATIASRGDIGVPVALDNDSSISKVFDSIASAITLEISPLIEMTGCSARLLESVRVALDN
jgi:ATP-binding protein involved in chromosome partitioning